MKKSISICIFIAVLAWLIAGLVLLFRKPEQSEPPLIVSEMEQGADMQTTAASEEQKEQLRESMAAPLGAAYFMKEEDGKLVVYRADGTTVYLETDIRCDELDLWLQEQAKDGIWFETDRELFDFLENYSS